jgi:histidinol-phosphatase (PHP family)
MGAPRVGSVTLPPDNHVHSQWSFDAPNQASMAGACKWAVSAGIPAIAFTEHVAFNEWGPGDRPARPGQSAYWSDEIKPLDVTGYLDCLEECRERFPQLRILSGAEVGEAQYFPTSARAVLGRAAFDRVLGSMHLVVHDGTLTPISARMMREIGPVIVAKMYFSEILDLVNACDFFEVLAHIDYPRRYWPAETAPYDEHSFQDEYRTVLRALAAADRVLEINTTTPLPSVDLVRWWHEEGGGAVSFGSDAHEPWRVGAYFETAVDIVEAAGFRPGRDALDYWRRLWTLIHAA